MAYNLGYVATGYNLGYTGAYNLAPSISAADAATEAQSATVTIVDYAAPPTELRLGGVVVAHTFNAGVLTYTAPLLPNNATLAVEVDVDGFTLSTTIVYTNTYPYTHIPGIVDDAAAFPNTSFGTTQLVEIKIITDADPLIATVNWPAYDADNFESPWLDFVTVASETAATTDVLFGFHVTETGYTDTFTRTLAVDAADTTAPILSNPAATQTGDITASGSVTTDEGNGTLFYLTTANASETASNIISLGDSQAVSGTGVQNVSITGLTASTSYYTHYVHQDAAGNNSTVATTVQFTTDAAPVSAPAGTVTFGTPTISDTTISQPTSYAGSDATGFERRIDGGAWLAYTSPIDLNGLTAETAYLIEARATNSLGAGPIASVTRTTSAEPVVLPDGIGPGRDNVITPGSTFVITSTITSLAAGESLLAFITIAGTRYYLTITGWSAGDITVTAPGNLPVSASPELTVQKISLIAA